MDTRLTRVPVKSWSMIYDVASKYPAQEDIPSVMMTKSVLVCAEVVASLNIHMYEVTTSLSICKSEVATLLYCD